MLPKEVTFEQGAKLKFDLLTFAVGESFVIRAFSDFLYSIAEL